MAACSACASRSTPSFLALALYFPRIILASLRLSGQQIYPPIQLELQHLKSLVRVEYTYLSIVYPFDWSGLGVHNHHVLVITALNHHSSYSRHAGNRLCRYVLNTFGKLTPLDSLADSSNLPSLRHLLRPQAANRPRIPKSPKARIAARSTDSKIASRSSRRAAETSHQSRSSIRESGRIPDRR